MRQIIYFIILLFLTVFLSRCNVFNDKADKIQKAQELKMQKMENIIQKQQDTITRLEIRLHQKQAALDSLRRVARTEKPEGVNRRDGKFHVIACSFKNPSYAKNYADSLIRKGYDPKIIKAPNSFNLVSIASFNSYGAALEKVKEIRKGGRYQVWVYEN